MSNTFVDTISKASTLSESGESFICVTMTHAKGSAPQDVGAKILVTENGLFSGTVGGGKVEAHCINVAIDLLKNTTESSISHTWNLQRDIGMTCGGEVSFFFEVIRSTPSWKIVVYGAGHVGQELCRLLLKLDCDLTVIDNRTEWLEKLPDDSKLKVVHATEMNQTISELDENSYVALMTMGHAYDVPILYEALKNRSFPYLGVIGSQSKRNRMESELLEMGIAKGDLPNFICPIGEKIGTNAPVEIAISICAQLLRVRG